jgi:hypothetical protein
MLFDGALADPDRCSHGAMRSIISMALEALRCVWMHEGVDGSDPIGLPVLLLIVDTLSRPVEQRLTRISVGSYM